MGAEMGLGNICPIFGHFNFGVMNHRAAVKRECTEQIDILKSGDCHTQLDA